MGVISLCLHRVEGQFTDFSLLFQFSWYFGFGMWRSEVYDCVCLLCRLSVGWGWGLGGVFRAELFLYVQAQFSSEGTADFRSKMGLGQVLQRK